MFLISRYTANDKNEWDAFLDNAKNGHFIFKRDYMDYHSDRFSDYSILARCQKNNNIVALLPANNSNGQLISHQGLTFGGLVISAKLTMKTVLEIFDSIMNYLNSLHKFNSLIYKRIPDFYTSYPAQEDLYALFLLGAKLIRRDVSVAIDLKNPLPFQTLRKRMINKAKKNNLKILEVDDYSSYWNMLNDVLMEQHQVTPTHSLSEIESLRNHFPSNIRCFVAMDDDEILAGTIIYETEMVAHAQYLACSSRGRNIGALDLVIGHLVQNVYLEKKYFNLGISTENGGRKLNQGLIAQKEGFGARTFIHDFYEVKI